MGYAKYVLSQTGLFPRWEPNAAGALDAANKVFEIKYHENGYYYIIPSKTDLRYLYDMVDIFASNGVILRPHKSGHYRCFVFRVPNNGQQFIKDVRHLIENPSESERTKYCREYAQRKRTVLFPNFVNKIKKR
ncbi:MAG: hypothetical protein IKS08_00345 [Alphaproteobacteria bacterium]|nr:hypothetical protein [Alphaproteobacteria bacterium]